MNDGKVSWRGSFAAIVTPFKKDGAIDDQKFVDNIELLISEGLHGLVVAGCTGESWSLEPEEKLHIFKLAVDAVKGKDIPVIAGTGGVVTQKVVDLSKKAKEVGVDGIMVLPPYYAIPSLSEVKDYYQAISDGAQIPILLYNIPRRTGNNLTPDFCMELADIDYVVAIKESSNDFIQVEETLAKVGDRILVFSGHSAERGVPAVLMGCPGFVSSMESQTMGREAISMYDLAVGGQIEEARRIQLRTMTLDKAMRGGLGTFPANLKGAMNILGRPGGYARPPLRDLDGAQKEKVQEVLKSLNIG